MYFKTRESETSGLNCGQSSGYPVSEIKPFRLEDNHIVSLRGQFASQHGHGLASQEGSLVVEANMNNAASR